MLALFLATLVIICCWLWQEVGRWVRSVLHGPAAFLALRMSGLLLSVHAASAGFGLDRSSATMFAGFKSWGGHQR